MADLAAAACRVIERVRQGFPAQLAAALIDRDFDRSLIHQHRMDWIGWAVPAIMTELAAHSLAIDSRCLTCDIAFADEYGWWEHIAPFIARRIACDPQRAIEALKRYRPDKV